jgi:hypothetical protein
MRCFPTPRLREHSRRSQIYHVAPMDASSTSRKWVYFVLIGGLCCLWRGPVVWLTRERERRFGIWSRS